jgi:hypothetical protein
MANAVAIFVLVVLTFLAIVIIPTTMTRRAINQVIKIFRRHNALDADHAKTIEELGLTPPTFQQRLFRTRDYKPRALESMKSSDVVQSTEDGRLYLSERALNLMLERESKDRRSI